MGEFFLAHPFFEMNNHWLDLIEKKRMFREIDEIGMEMYATGMTFGDFLDILDEEQLEFLRSMSVNEWLTDFDEFAFAMDVKAP